MTNLKGDLHLRPTSSDEALTVILAEQPDDLTDELEAFLRSQNDPND